MLRLLVKKASKEANLPCIQLCNLYSTKQSGDVPDGRNMRINDNSNEPVEKIKRVWKREKETLKRNLFFWRDYKNPTIDEKTGRVLDWDSPESPIFPNHCDILIIGGGAMGSSAAFWCQRLANQSLRVVVVEKDPTYKQASTVLSVGGLRQQFSLEENIYMSLFGAEFLRNINEYLGIEGEPPIDCQFHPYGYLTLSTPETAEILKENSELQNSIGARNVILRSSQLKEKFPWLNTDGIELGCLGLENEGWFDPWILLNSFKKKAKSLGAEYITAKAMGFNFTKRKDMIITGVEAGKYEELNYCIVQTEDGRLRPITFSKCIIAAGAFSANVARMAKIGCGAGMLSVPLPVEPRKRYVYCFHAPDGPGLNIPQTIDPTGVYFRREGLANNYICGLCPTEDEEPSIDNLDVDNEFFDNRIWPILAARVKGFESLKLKSSWAGYYEYNKFDENGIIGFHPYYDNVIFATGFSGHGIQQAPAVGRAVSELITDSEYKTINLDRLSFERFITREPMRELNIW